MPQSGLGVCFVCKHFLLNSENRSKEGLMKGLEHAKHFRIKSASSDVN